jgi:hypothetical protein
MMTGVIHGAIRDPTGVALPGVTITLRHLGIGISRTYHTSAAGLFTAVLLPAGAYELSAQLMNFATVRTTGITVTVGQVRSVKVVMRPSAAGRSEISLLT